MSQPHISAARWPFSRRRVWCMSTKLGIIGFGLPGLLWLLPLAAVHAQTTVSYTFEDERLRGTATRMKVPPKILAESGNHFMRITGSTGDCHAIPAAKCPPRNRSTVKFTTSYARMPLLSDATRRQTYSVRIRFNDDNTGTDGVVWELAQYAPPLGGYGTRDGKGPVFICWRNDGHVKCRANYANETKWNMVDLGVVPAGSWHTYTVNAVWSHDPNQGRIELYLDGSLRLVVTGRGTNLGPASHRLPSLTAGLYGDNAIGRVDVDDVVAKPWLPSGNSDSVTLSAPTNLRLVSGE